MGEGKQPKSVVKYRFMEDIAERCGNCSMFKDWRCTAVQGIIIPLMVCNLWEARNATVPEPRPAE